MTNSNEKQDCVERIETGEVQMIDGISCEIIKWRFRSVKGSYHIAYRFTVPGWPECEITGLRATRRIIRGRTDLAVRNTLGIE